MQLDAKRKKPEDEFERKLLADGFISHVLARDETDEEFDAFERLAFEGQPLSEMIVRERRYGGCLFGEQRPW